ncbi:MAG: PAS domain S-box protein [Deltaproteobacteria bacterium]|nr:PAS domain S-box protein [Deltaproteobacteria bacterium]
MKRGDKDKEKSLPHSEDRFRLLFDSAADALFLHDLEGRFVEVNQTACDSLGYTREELLQLPFSTIVKDWDPKALDDLWARVIQGEKLTVQVLHRRQNGTTFPVEVRLSPFEYAGRPHILAAARDTAERLWAEEALRTSESFLNSIIDQSPYPMWISDDRGTLLRLNQTCQDLLHLTAAEVVGKYNVFQDNIVEEQGFFSLLQRVFEKGQTVRFELAYDIFRLKVPQLRSAKSVILDVTVSPIIDASGRITNAVFQHVDITQLKQTEEALRESQEYLKTVMESVGAGIVVVDAETRQIVDINPFAEEIIGMPREEIIGKRCHEHICPAEIGKCPVMDLGLTVDQSERSLLTGCGQTIPILKTVTHFQKEGRKYLLESFLDITERKQVEEALRDSERRLSEIIDFLPDATFAIDRTGKVIAWNRAIEEMTGVKAESIIGKGDYEYALPFYGIRRPILIDLVYMSDEEIEKKYIFVQRQGDVLLAEADVPLKGKMHLLWGKARPLYDREGNIVGAIEAIRDITERRQAERALRESEARFRQVVESSPLPIGIGNDAGMIEYVNPKFVETFGYNLEDVPRIADWFRLAYPDPAYRQGLVSRWQESLEKITRENGTAEVAEVEVTCKDGSKRIMEIFGTLMGNKSLVVFRDLTERKRAEEALRESEARFRQMVEY